MQRAWTIEETKLLKKHYSMMPTQKLAALLQRSYKAVKERAKKYKLRKIIVSGSPWTKKRIRILRELYANTTIAEISKLINLTEKQIASKAFKLGLRKTKEFRINCGKKYGYKSGEKPANYGLKQHEYMSLEAIERTKTTRFKKGHQPYQTKENDGVIVIRNSHKDRNERPYKWIRISVGNWQMLHVYNWVKSNGQVPKGYIVVFKSADTMNCDKENLMLITRQELMARNTMHQYPPEVKRAIKRISKLNKKIRYAEKQIQ